MKVEQGAGLTAPGRGSKMQCSVKYKAQHKIQNAVKIEDNAKHKVQITGQCTKVNRNVNYDTGAGQHRSPFHLTDPFVSAGLSVHWLSSSAVHWMFDEVKTIISGPRQTLSHSGRPDGSPRWS